MTGQTYQVNYIVNVDAANAQSAINSFKRAVASMDKATKPITDLQRKVRGLVETMSALNRGKYSVKIDTRPATQKIGKLIRALQMAKVEVQQLNAMGVTLGGVGNKKKTASRTAATAAPIGGSSSRTRTAPSRSSSTTTAATRRYATSVMRHPTNLGYKLWGPTPLPNNGGMAIDMLKGMGIAYGIAGAGMLVSEVVNQAAEYDNAMKTVENILKSHDTAENFAGRFAQMTQVVRNVGMKTKFKVTEVADAAKFLAMAGFNVNAIQQAISPIADIALVGDTELGKTADLVTNIMTAYNIEPNKMRNAADIMTNTFTMSNTTLTEIAEAYKYAASLLSAGEVSFEEATAAIGVLGDAGIKGSQAGTTMRTIMANLANPTKKQRAGWEDIGISLTDKNGQRKDILQIFQELHDKNLDVDAYYRIFHKTAASGAVALATHADKWEKVYLENFLAGGMTRRLAEEKQNTFQGLWAQLVSVFTDQGVTAFNGVQGALRGWMKMAINWMDPNKNPDAQKVFKEVANSLMEFIQILIDASKWFVWFFDKFGGLVKTWAKFQLMIWPVVKAVTALRSVFLGLLGLRKVGAVMVGLAGSFTKLGRAATVATAVMPYGAGAAAGSAPMSPFGFAAGMAGFAPLSYKQYIKASKGLNLSRPHASTSGYYLNRIDNLGREAEVAAWNSGVYQARQAEDAAALKRYKQNQKTFNKRVRNMQIRNGLKGFGKMGVGAAGMMLGMHQMTKENANGWDVASGGLFAAAGMAAMVGGPIGWIAAAGLALGGLGASLASFNQNLNALSGFVNDFSNSHQLLDGALLNGNTRTERYLEFVWRKNYDINDLIQRRIELMKELLGIETPNATTTKDVGNETYKTMYEKFYAADSMWGSRGAASRAADLFNKYGQEFGLSVRNYGGDWYYQDANGKYIRFANPKGSSDTNDAVMYDVAAAMELLHGQYRSKIMDENQHRLAQILYGKATVEDAKNWRDTFAATYGPASWATLIRPDQWNEDTDVAKYWSGEDIAKSYMGAQLLWKSMYQMVEAQNAIADFKEKLAAGNLTENDVVRALRWGDYDVLGQTLADYNPNDVTSWFRNMGYAGDGIWRDPSGRETPEVMAQTAAGQMQRLLESIQKLGLEADPSTQALQTYANTLLTLAQSFMGSNEALSGSHDGEIKELNGQKWRWNATTKQWELIDDNNQPAQISQGLVDMSNNMNTLLTTVQNVNSQWPTLFPTVYPINSGWGYNSASPYNWGTDNNNLTTNGLLWNPLTNTNNGQPFSWWPSWNNGNNLFTPQQTYRTTGVTMTPQQMGNAVAKPNAPGVHTPTGNNHNEGTNNGGRTGTRTSDYKSHQKERAIPKQININIQNLMKVDSIDMTNENNVAIIEKLKEKVAYALYEAAADGTMMLNGLSNT
jgi:TP901 family phage tail tape measure protein